MPYPVTPLSPKTHPLFLEELLPLLTEERDPLRNFLCSIWGMEPKASRLSRLDWQRSDGIGDNGLQRRPEKSWGSSHMLRSLWRNLKPTVLLWTVREPHWSDMSQVAQKSFTALCPPVDTVAWRDPVRNLFRQCFQRGLWRPRPGPPWQCLL